ncbi:F-box protein SKIP23-like [Chenopodium quinoa]|uniref:F-box protein SKIP23-like n=1 Tax=Chenopodium quinoa TaxID=63459 RepID=UPI000B797E8C|nr:F-box protein SKIP23-like [Chenopodium quinoa]
MAQSSATRGRGKTSRCRKREVDWSELSPEVLLAIGKRLESRIDVCKFRSVCIKWRSSLPLPQNPNFSNPLLPLQLQIPKANPLPFSKSFHIFTLVATTVFLVQPLDFDPNNSDSKCMILSVEERKPGKFRNLYPVSRKPVSFKDPTFPKSLNLAEFRVTEIGKGYLLRVLAKSNYAEHGYDGCKVILCLNSDETCPYNAADNCTAIVLYTDGTLIGLNLRDGNWRYVHQSLVRRFKDVLWLRGLVYAVDDGGRLYVIDHLTLKVIETIVDHPILTGFHAISLVGSSDEVYLIVVSCKKTYKLNQMQRRWVEMKTLGNRMVFLGFDGSFMVSTKSLFDCDGNIVIFNREIFGAYQFNESVFREAARDLGILMYSEGTGVALSYETVSNALWPPPTWFWQYTFPSNWDAANNLQQGGHDYWPLNIHKKQKKAATPSMQADKQPQNAKSNKSVASKVTFEGVDIKSDLVSTLQKIWAKHGNVVEGVQSKDMLKCVLKSLAKAVIILQSSSGRTLSKEQCSDLSSVLMDLKRLQLRVEWLEPFVEKAIKLHQSKPMVDALEDLEKYIARTKEMKIKFTKELANLEEVEKELEEDKTLISKEIPIVGQIDLDQCIGDGML